MPTYDYKCDACGHTFEEWQSFTAEKLTRCPSCKTDKLQRLFGSGAAIVFKGSGFYDTDYRQADEKKKSERAGVKPPADAPAEAAAETKAGAKPDAPAKGETTAANPEPKAAKADTPAAKPAAAKE